MKCSVCKDREAQHFLDEKGAEVCDICLAFDIYNELADQEEDAAQDVVRVTNMCPPGTDEDKKKRFLYVIVKGALLDGANHNNPYVNMNTYANLGKKYDVLDLVSLLFDDTFKKPVDINLYVTDDEYDDEPLFL